MWIANFSRTNIKNGFHPFVEDRTILIQIIDPASFPPKSSYKFNEVHVFEFFDLDDKDEGFEEAKITDEQAQQLVHILQKAKEDGNNVVVHCNAGMCRSGAVAEVGTILGFEDLEYPRTPNLLVKRKMLEQLGFYDGYVHT